MSAHRPKLSVVMPAYNELATIDEILERVAAVPIEKEIIVVDDGSTDGTRDHLKELEERWSGEEHPHATLRVFLQPQNGGKGKALRTGFAHARGEVTIVQDADLEYDPDDYPKVVGPILEGRAEVVYGSRYADIGPRDLLDWHTFGNQLLTWSSNLLTGLRLSDMETCYKAFRTELLQSLDLREDRFGFEPEVTAQLARRGVRPMEVGIAYESRGWDEGKKIGWKDGVEAYRVMLTQAFDRLRSR
ncbi:MAG: glycosyltransferase family 2 protein [Deltaproteobacteria bacterium]|nr:glycosyltransferase family 2 protein [Deltaproteobacteria bacterium]